MKTINIQPISKVDRSTASELLVHSIFFTIQGEGPNVGKPAVFLRLGGCNLQCPGCDTDYSSDLQRLGVGAIIQRIRENWTSQVEHRCQHGYRSEPPLVVITGGEPFRQSLEVLINALFNAGYRVQIETNGTIGFTSTSSLSKRVWQELQIVVSPKAGKVAENLWPFIDAYKYVLDADHIDPNDGLPTSVLGLPGKPARPFPDFEGEVYVQPADERREGIGVSQHGSEQGMLVSCQFSDRERNKRNLEAAIGSAMKYGYRLCLQTHKIAGLD